MRTLWLLLTISFLAVAAVPVGQAQDSERITVLDDTVYMQFGDKLIFHLEVVSPAEITQVMLSYGQAGRVDEISVRPTGFVPGSRVLLDYTHDLKTQPVQAFSQLEFKWTISDARGHRLTTPVQGFVYEDKRFTWQQISDEDNLTVHWYGKDVSFGRTALYVAQQARNRIMADLGGNPNHPIKLYIYASAADLLGAIPIDRKEWLVGQAYPGTGTCLVVIPQAETTEQELERVIPHEISHLLVGTVTPNLPYWLDEGLATDNEGVSDSGPQLLMASAVKQDQLIPLDNLCDRFPADMQQAALAYAQSRSLVAFIREVYGQSGIQNLIDAYKHTDDCSAGVQRALGISLSTLEAQWKNSQHQSGNLFDMLAASWAWIALWLGSLIITLLLVQSVAWPAGKSPRAAADRSGSDSDEIHLTSQG